MAHEPDELKGRWAHVPRPAVCAAPVRPVPVVERSPVPGTGDPAPGEGAYRYGPPGTGVRYDRYRIGYRSALPVPLGRTGTARSYRYRSVVLVPAVARSVPVTGNGDSPTERESASPVTVRGHCPPVPVRRVPGGCTAVVRTARRAGSTSRRGRASGDAW